jgi:hypothetical protein
MGKRNKCMDIHPNWRSTSDDKGLGPSVIRAYNIRKTFYFHELM